MLTIRRFGCIIQLLKSFKVSTPWRRMHSTPNVPSKKPNELSMDELEHELFQLFKRTMFQQRYADVVHTS